ncbi:hypothetical protein [Geomicrobium sp. JCM 19037]|nr:hypothetical protein [Geomicrobium sp. JCM 19037]
MSDQLCGSVERINKSIDKKLEIVTKRMDGKERMAYMNVDGG